MGVSSLSQRKDGAWHQNHLQTKIGNDGRIEMYKGRFVAQGFRQMKGIHYDESSSPTPSKASIKMVLGLVAVKDWELGQLDVDMPCLEANVKKELYIELPEDYHNTCDQVGRLQKVIYGFVHKPDRYGRKRLAPNSPQRGSSNVRPTHACSGEYCAATSSSSS